MDCVNKLAPFQKSAAFFKFYKRKTLAVYLYMAYFQACYISSTMRGPSLFVAGGWLQKLGKKLNIF